MEGVFLACAVLGGTFLVAQFVLTLLGMGHHDADFDHDVGADAGHGFDGAGAHHDAQSHSSDTANAFFRAFSVRTVTAAVTFFGLCGLAATKADLPAPQPLLLAVLGGASALYSVYYLMRSIYRLKADGTERVARSVGTQGTVYLTIPGHNAGPGKIHFSLQNRLVEYAAVTDGDTLVTGTSVVIVDVVAPDTVKVELLPQTARPSHV